MRSLATIPLLITWPDSSWIGSYDFSKVGLRRNLDFLPLAAARVYALFLNSTMQSTVHDTVDCLDVLCTVHPACRALGCCACWAACCSSRFDPVDYLLFIVDYLKPLPKSILCRIQSSRLFSSSGRLLRQDFMIF